MLSSLPRPFSVAIFGASGGIGGAIADQIASSQVAERIFTGSRKLGIAEGAITPFAFDLHHEDSIAAAANMMRTAPPLRLVLVATGQLHGPTIRPEKTWRDQTVDAYAHAFAVNAIGPALIGKHLLPLLPRDGKSVFAAMSARVGSISDNRLGGWHAYRASKAALNMIVTNFAAELAHTRKEALAVTLHPGTVATALSAPFRRGVARERLMAPDYAASCLLDQINVLEPADSGGLFAWNGEQIGF